MFSCSTFITGAYPMAPTFQELDISPAGESKFWRALIETPNIRGLEIPVWEDARIGRHSEDALMQYLGDDRLRGTKHVLTCIVGTMNRMRGDAAISLKPNPHFGLASDSPDARREAVTLLQATCELIGRLSAHLGRNPILALQVHSGPDRSPEGVSSSPGAFEASLLEALKWDWKGTKIVVEHCDAFVPGETDHKPQKGFLPITDEIAVLRAVNARGSAQGTPLGLTINWGRSVVENRDPQAALRHIELAAGAELLSGVMFSGTTNDPTSPYAPDGDIWRDNHMPPLPEQGLLGAPRSLLTRGHMQSCLAAARSMALDYLGLKIMSHPIGSVPLDERVQLLRDGVSMLVSVSADFLRPKE